VSPEIAAQLRAYLKGATGAGGTGSRAQVGSYGVLGKTGTARRIRNGKYVNEYVASFAAMFPADDPQLVVVVKIDGPTSGQFYGGEVAAPVVRTMLEQALASKRVSFDRARMLGGQPASIASAAPTRPQVPHAAPTRVVVPWPAPPDSVGVVTAVVPPLVGLSVRAAAAALHRRGFEVSAPGAGTVRGSSPVAGTDARVGTTVRLQVE
jgi:membrane peptidoglycan carboxypeptidase